MIKIDWGNKEEERYKKIMQNPNKHNKIKEQMREYGTNRTKELKIIGINSRGAHHLFY